MPLTQAMIEQAAAYILRARASGEAYAPIPDECRPADIADGLAISEQVSQNLGRRTIAWKAGFSSTDHMAEIDVQSPPWGRFFDGMLFDSPARLPGKSFIQPLMEAEIAFRMGASLPARAGGYDGAEITAAVASAHIVIEGADLRFRDGLDVGIPSLVADSFLTRSLVVGPAIEQWRDTDLNGIPIELMIDDEPAGTAFKGGERCRPMDVLIMLINDLAAQNIDVNEGDVITTGAAAEPVLPRAGQTVTARFGGIGDVVAELAV